MKQNKRVISLGLSILGLSLLAAASEAANLSKPDAAPADSPTSYSAAALYDLGNTYARHGETALAMLSYERARVLAPRDPDLEANLQSVRHSADLPAAAGGDAPHFRLMAPNATYWFGVTGLLVAGISGLLLVKERVSGLVTLRIGLVAGLLTVGYALVDATLTARLLREAVVMRAVAASSSPIVDADALFTLPPATVVHIQDEHGSFFLVRDSYGNVGWVPRREITPVDPQGAFHA